MYLSIFICAFEVIIVTFFTERVIWIEGTVNGMHISIVVVHDIDTAAGELLDPLCREDNPDAFIDWYEIGGRWNGYIRTKKGEFVNEACVADVDFNYDHHAQCTSDEFKLAPYGFISADGECYEGDGLEQYIKTLRPKKLYSITTADCHVSFFPGAGFMMGPC